MPGTPLLLRDPDYVRSIERGLAVIATLGHPGPGATCVGLVLLAALDAEQFDGYLARVELRALTPATVATAPALRAELERVRRQRFAVVDQELELGLRSAAAPIHDTAGRVVAAANLGALAGRITVATLRTRLLPPLRATAASIERDLAAARP